MPLVGDCGFFFSVSLQDGAGSCGLGASFLSQGVVWTALNVCENLDKSFKKLSICSEFFSFAIKGLTLSEKSGFCER